MKLSQNGPQSSPTTIRQFGHKEVAATAQKTALHQNGWKEVDNHCFGHKDVMGDCGFFGPKWLQAVARHSVRVALKAHIVELLRHLIAHIVELLKQLRQY